MDQVKDYSDERLYSGCVYCGMTVETREHVPSKVFLDMPYPENLPVVGSCKECNEGFSRDEQYVACLIEVVRVGSSDPSDMRRQLIAATLARSGRLRALIDAGRSEQAGLIQYSFDRERLSRVLVKLARGHACFELAAWNLGEPEEVWWAPLISLADSEREAFDAPHVVETFGEIGSRAVSRMMVIQPTLTSSTGEMIQSFPPLVISDWLDVQEGRYRFLAVDSGGDVVVSITISEYLAARVRWKK
ncbi:hypothetical protein MOQ21_16595 [Stenotrophomonas maltophilia]|nr:hypothetical protein [Stenotrophomonas geniculata]MCI1091311.1 hypothetical protein [Stenotrophomonas maltophilia]MCI1129441.1 hypothetical protein [Stenotrophomonas maltophilia]